MTDKPSQAPEQSGVVTRRMTEFTLAFAESLKDPSIIQSIGKIVASANSGILDKISQQETLIRKLQCSLAEKDKEIGDLESRIILLEKRVDENEQYNRKSSIRLSGIPEAESEEGEVEDKVIRICNNHIKVDPPLEKKDIVVAHRIGQKRAGNTCRPILVKLAALKIKDRIIRNRKNLKNISGNGKLKIYVSDDLTEARSYLAYKARMMKRDKHIRDTWVYNCKILVKDNVGRIHQIQCEADLEQLLPD